MNREQCPICLSQDTDQVDVQWESDIVHEMRVCSNCPAEFRNSYDLFEQASDRLDIDDAIAHMDA
jgi:transcriptional regulator NrdR family protein